MSKLQINMESLVEMMGKKIDTMLDTKIAALEQNLLAKFEAMLDQKLEILNKDGTIKQGDRITAPTTGASDTSNIKAIILGDSVTRDLSPNGVSNIAGETVRIRSKGGATPSTVLSQDLPNATKIVLHAGANTLSAVANDNDKDDETKAQEVASAVKEKLDSLKADAATNASTVFYSSILKRSDLGDKLNKSTVNMHLLIDKANGLIRDYCNERHFKFIDNNNVGVDDLWDGIHVNESGAKKLAKNIGKAIRTSDSVTSLNYHIEDENTPYTKLEIKHIGNRPSHLKRRTAQHPKNEKTSPRAPPFLPPLYPYWSVPEFYRQQHMNAPRMPPYPVVNQSAP